MTFFHSESGNSGQFGELTRDRLVRLGSTLNDSSNCSDFDKFSEIGRMNLPPVDQGKSASSTFGFLNLSSPSKPSPSSIDSGVSARRFSPTPFSLRDARSISVSRFSIVWIYDSKAASAAAVSSPTASIIRLSICEYVAALDLDPFLY